MGLTPLIEQPFFEELRERAALMLKEGLTNSALARMLARDYPVSNFTIYGAHRRGDIVQGVVA